MKVDETGVICIDATTIGGEDLYLLPRTVMGVMKDAYEEPGIDLVTYYVIAARMIKISCDNANNCTLEVMSCLGNFTCVL